MMANFTGDFDRDDGLLGGFGMDRAEDFSGDTDPREVAQAMLAQVALLGEALKPYTAPAVRDAVRTFVAATMDSMADMYVQGQGVEAQSDAGEATTRALRAAAEEEAQQYLANYRRNQGGEA